jgi:hypothetical protein
MDASRGSNKKPHVVLDVLGPTVEFLVLPSESAAGYCIMKGTIPPGRVGPSSQSSGRREFFSSLWQASGSGSAKGWFQMDKHERGRFRHVPQDVRHAWKNKSNEPAVTIIVTTPRLGRFFQEIGRPVTVDAFSQAPSPADIQRFVEVAARYDHWLASPQENAAVGIKLS